MNCGAHKIAERRTQRRWRVVLFLLWSSAGVLVGVSGDLLGPMRFDAYDILGSVLMWPVLVVFGGNHVTIPWVRDFCVFGGLAFMPGHIVLLVFCLLRAYRWTYVGAFLWCAQGFFQLCHRLPPIMSV